jgi:hypothetical protein
MYKKTGLFNESTLFANQLHHFQINGAWFYLPVIYWPIQSYKDFLFFSAAIWYKIASCFR